MKKIVAEIINIGDEILYGQITNTNVRWMSTELDKLGIKVGRQTIIGDEAEPILQALNAAKQVADIILITGGLGPTKDDITKKTLADYFETELVPNEEALTAIRNYFETRGREMMPGYEIMALMPATAQYISNNAGTAPGMWFEKEGKIIVSMPGVPKEMEMLMEESVLPKLKAHFQTPSIYHKVIRTFGAGESKIAAKIADWEDNLPENIKLAYLPDYGIVNLRLTAFGKSQEELEKQVDAEIEKVKMLIPNYIFGYNKDEMEEIVGALLVKEGKTVATAESCSGGFLAHLFTKVSGSSRYFEGGIVSYSNDIKMNRLGVKEETLKNHGAVSEETIRQMAENVREKFKTDIGVASSGVAGPGGGSPEKPVGTVWIAYADREGTYTKKLSLTPVRDFNIKLTSYLILDLIRKKLLGLIR